MKCPNCGRFCKNDDRYAHCKTCGEVDLTLNVTKRDLFEYTCTNCGCRRETVIRDRLDDGLCRNCRRMGVSKNQEPLFPDMIVGVDHSEGRDRTVEVVMQKDESGIKVTGMVVDGEDHSVKKYAWDYLAEAANNGNERGVEMAKLLSKVGLDHSRNILDINCGFAPLYPFFPKFQRYVGFDSSQECIDWCTDKYRLGEWHCVDDQGFSMAVPVYKFDTFVFTGITSGNRPWESQTEHESFARLLSTYKPSVVILETATTVPLVKHVDPIIMALVKAEYQQTVDAKYTIKSYPKNGERLLWAYKLVKHHDDGTIEDVSIEEVEDVDAI